MSKRILVVANETVTGRVLHRAILDQAAEADAVELLVVAPALNSRLRHWLSDVDRARRAAELRLDQCLETLWTYGLDARGAVGDADPMQAIEDGLHAFPAEEIVIATHPPGRSHWLEHRLVERARRRFEQPVVHVVVDAVFGREDVVAA
jgi:hypothetical protein